MRDNLINFFIWLSAMFMVFLIFGCYLLSFFFWITNLSKQNDLQIFSGLISISLSSLYACFAIIKIAVQTQKKLSTDVLRMPPFSQPLLRNLKLIGEIVVIQSINWYFQHFSGEALMFSLAFNLFYFVLSFFDYGYIYLILHLSPSGQARFIRYYKFHQKGIYKYFK